MTKLAPLALSLGLAIVAGCTKPNPAVCCLDQADCNEVGISEVRNCSPGLACVEHQCEVPTCSMTGCEATMPVCNITTDVCEGCTTNDDCSRFTASPVCDTATGGCFECVAATDCPSTKPLCDSHACRGCKLDSECASGACGDDGSCVAEDAVVYLDPAGTDAGTCTRTAPCRKIAFALSQTGDSRNHIVMNMGGYVEGLIMIDSIRSAASSIYVHGSGSSLARASGGDSDLLQTYIPTTIRNLELNSSLNTASGHLVTVMGSFLLLDHVVVRNANQGLQANGELTANDLLIEDVNLGIDVTATGKLTLDRAEIRRGIVAINSDQVGGYVAIKNLLVWGTSDIALDLSQSTGTIDSSTIADSGTDQGTGARAVQCPTGAPVGVTMRSSIVWAPGTTARVPVEGCNIVSSIAGPTPASGASNVNPQFVDSGNHDYHLAATSPAKDMVDAGPSTDFEGDPRPRGARFDIGADEAP